MRRHLLRCALLMALLLGSAGIGTVAALDWQIETVDASEGYTGEWPSLALDSAGNPHISYDGGCLKYAVHNGSAWEVQTVDPTVSVGYGTSLALDAADNQHIAYHDYTNDDLRYAAWDGSAWRTETVDSAGSVGAYPSLALDRAGDPHISYGDATNRTVKYAVFDGSAWLVEPAVPIWKYGPRQTSLALDDAGVPHIAYLNGTRANYTEFTGLAWQSETMGSGDSPSLALDPVGNPHIAYIDPSSTALLYRAHDGPDWRTEWVERTGVVEYNHWSYGGMTSLALDTADNPRISYLHEASGALKYAAYNASSWQWDVETVAWPCGAGTYSSLALDGADNPRIAYSCNTDLVFARAIVPKLSVRIVPGGAGVPTATDAVGLFDDVNGNGRKDFADVVLYFNQLGWIAANEPLAAFDYNGNGRIDFADVIWLFDRLGTPARSTFTVRAAAIGPGTIQPSGDLTVREGENITFTLRVGPGVVTPSGTGSGWLIGNEVRVDPVVAPTPYPEPTRTYGPYPTSYSYTPSYTLQDVRANHTVYGVFYRAGWMTC